MKLDDILQQIDRAVAPPMDKRAALSILDDISAAVDARIDALRSDIVNDKDA